MTGGLVHDAIWSRPPLDGGTGGGGTGGGGGPATGISRKSAIGGGGPASPLAQVKEKYFGPMQRGFKVAVNLYRATFNVFTWRLFGTSFWILALLVAASVAAFSFPYRPAGYLAAVYFAGPQNLLISRLRFRAVCDSQEEESESRSGEAGEEGGGEGGRPAEAGKPRKPGKFAYFVKQVSGRSGGEKKKGGEREREKEKKRREKREREERAKNLVVKPPCRNALSFRRMFDDQNLTVIRSGRTVRREGGGTEIR